MDAKQLALERESTISQLNAFTRQENTAVETYRQALEHLKGATHELLLRQCLRSHAARVTMLTDEVGRLGGKPTQGSGTWGTLAKLVEDGAQLIGEKAAIAVLEQEEERGTKYYYGELGKLSSDVRGFIEQYILPEQESTQRALGSLKRAMG